MLTSHSQDECWCYFVLTFLFVAASHIKNQVQTKSPSAPTALHPTRRLSRFSCDGSILQIDSDTGSKTVWQNRQSALVLQLITNITWNFRNKSTSKTQELLFTVGFKNNIYALTLTDWSVCSLPQLSHTHTHTLILASQCKVRFSGCFHFREHGWFILCCSGAAAITHH